LGCSVRVWAPDVHKIKQVLSGGPSDIVTPARLVECGIESTWCGGGFKGAGAYEEVQLVWSQDPVHKNFLRPGKLIRTIGEIPVPNGSGPALYIYAKVIRGWYDCSETQGERRVIEEL